MKRTLEDIRENLDVWYCDNETVLELCAEVERLNSVVAKLTRDCNSLEDDVRYNGEALARANEMKGEIDRLQAIVDRLLQGIDFAAQKLLCVELERSIREVPEIVKACDRQALQILREAAEKARKP
jgi:outer membrane murein-binding lipoprotein Lpp